MTKSESLKQKVLELLIALRVLVVAILGAIGFACVLLGPTPTLAQDKSQALSTPQLEQLLAPIALYPDGLLSQILMASTYPLEVVEAGRWARDNPNVTGKALEDAMQQQSWDPSVKALTSVPQTLAMMNDKLSWTQQLGDTFLAQQEDVLAAVQTLRARADAQGNLKSSDKQKVTKVERPKGGAAPGGAAAAPSGAVAAAGPIYTIEPVDPMQYAVPVYDPAVAYGDWPYPDYAPFYWTPPGYAGYGLFGYGAAALAGAAIWGGVDWWRNRVNVNVNNFNRFNRTNIANANWSHNPAHRGNVPYRNSGVAQRYGSQSKAAARDAFRGKADAGRRDMGKQGNARTNAGAGNRAANAGNRAANTGNRAANAKQGNRAANTGNRAANTRQAGASNRSQKSARAPQHNRTAARPNTARPNQAAHARPAAQRPNVAARGGMQRANVNLARGGGGMRAGGGMRGGGGFRGGGRRR